MLCMQVVGIMLGMLSLGFIADKIGRKWGSVCCAAFMFVGGILLTASSGPTLAGWAIMFTISQVCCCNSALLLNPASVALICLAFSVIAGLTRVMC